MLPAPTREAIYGTRWTRFSTFAMDPTGQTMWSIPPQFITDASSGNLPAVSWLIPMGAPGEADHPPGSICTGENWTVKEINAIMNNPSLWASTAIVLTWDDYGGFYDHVPPPSGPQPNMQYGARVPAIIMSPYVNPGFIDDTFNSFGSMLKFAEDVFGIGSTGGLDASSNDLFEAFNFNQTPLSPLVLQQRTCPTATPTPTPTPTATPTRVPTATPTSTPTAAYLAVTPSTTSAGQTLTVKGAGYARSEQVKLYWDSTTTSSVATAKTTSSGSFTTKLTVPALPAGAHTVIAVGQTSGTSTTAAVQVTPAIVLQTTSGAPGLGDSVTGSGFAPDETVNLSWDATGGPSLGSAMTDQTGSFASTGITIPTATYGSHTIYGLDSQRRQRDSPLQDHSHGEFSAE